MAEGAGSFDDKTVIGTIEQNKADRRIGRGKKAINLSLTDLNQILKPGWWAP